MWLIKFLFSSILQTWYVELRISRSISESPLEFEITRVDCSSVAASLLFILFSMKCHFCITKACLYNFGHLKPYFYIVKLGFTEVYVSFLISAQKHLLWYSLEPPCRGGSNGCPQSMFGAGIWKYQIFYLKAFSFFLWGNLQYIGIGVFP